jgi:20S proteasome alpha/beta subunit
MTLILCIPFDKGAVLASDGQVTMGLFKTRAKKIKKLNENCIWGAAGNLHFIQIMEKELFSLPEKEKPLSELRWELCSKVKESIQNLPPASQPYSGSFVFVEYKENITHILNIQENGLSVMLENVPFATGIGEQFAYTLLQKYQDLIPEKISNKLAELLAYKIIAETIETIAIGVGLPIDIWELPPVKNLSKEELESLEETYLGLKKAEIEMFLKGE